MRNRAGQGKGGIRLSDSQRIAWLQLIRSDNVGPVGIMAQTPEPTGQGHD
jgi:hypothetical protein